MIFNTWLFAVFGIVVFVTHWYLIPKKWRPYFLMCAGLAFYASAIPAYLVLVLGLGLVTFAVARWLLALLQGKTHARQSALAVGVAASVAVLVFFKYSKFFGLTFGALCKGGCVNFVPNIIVPLAISFFTFEFVHLLVDVYKGSIKRVGARDFWLFTLFFPTMVAGPIKRYQNFVPQIDRVQAMERLDGLVFAAGLYRVLLGLAKKSIVADSMNPLIQPLLTPAAFYTTADYWIAALAYTAKIYFDFSGYSDIAIGCAQLLGFQILENFDRPYWSENISIFWRRWHISLSSWIRDYLFIPLGGSRRGKLLTFANLAVVMALAGLWHGAAWHFVLWGAWHGVGLGLHRIWSNVIVGRIHGGPANPAGLAAISILATFVFVVFGWVLFASPSIPVAAFVYSKMIGLHS